MCVSLSAHMQLQYISTHTHAFKCVLFPSQQFDQIHSGAVALSHLHSDGDLVCRLSPAVTGAVMQGDMAGCPVHLHTHTWGKLLNPTDSPICLSNCSLSNTLSSSRQFSPFTNKLIVLSQSCECSNKLHHAVIQNGITY